jgi:hypothetical protein
MIVRMRYHLSMGRLRRSSIMAMFVQVAVPEEHVLAVYRLLLDLEEQAKDGATTMARAKSTARTARTESGRVDLTYAP